MNSAIIVMTILGCGQTDAACDYIRTVEASYQSRAECEAASERELLKTGSDDYPSVIAVCEPHREIAAAPAPELSGPVIAGPEVVPMPAELKSANPVTWTITKARQMVGGLKNAVRAGWLGVTGRGTAKEERDPVPLGRHVSAGM